MDAADCISAVEDNVDNLVKSKFGNSGKKYDDLKQRQKIRKIKTLESYVEQALSFAETFGLKPINLDCKSESGKNVTLNLLDSNKQLCL